MKRRRIAVFTGSRTEYGIIRPILKEINKSRKLELLLIVSAVHLLKKFGSTYDLIKKDKFLISGMIKMTLEHESCGKMGYEVASGIKKLTKLLIEKKANILLLVGDRSETFSAAAAGALLPLPIAHIHGGEKSKAGLDESMRHAITKLSHIHFVSTPQSRDRVIRMGENPTKVFLVGAAGIDDFKKVPKLSRKRIEKKLKIKITKPLLVVLQHPVTTSVEKSGVEMRQTLKAVSKLPGTKVVIYPNGDPGSEKMIEQIEKFRRNPNFYIFPNIEHSLYINLLRISSTLIGNSSGGIIETASIQLPTVNIGPRQLGRERNFNVVDVNNNYEEIINAIEKCIYNKNFINRARESKNIYGDGESSRRIVAVLEKIRIDNNLLQKHFYDAAN